MWSNKTSAPKSAPHTAIRGAFRKVFRLNLGFEKNLVLSTFYYGVKPAYQGHQGYQNYQDDQGHQAPPRPSESTAVFSSNKNSI